jgi:hypothetical protein
MGMAVSTGIGRFSGKNLRPYHISLATLPPLHKGHCRIKRLGVKMIS